MNQVQLLGRLGKDPESRVAHSGDRVVNFSLATNWRKNGQTETDWHRCVAFGKTADVIAEWVHKGDQLAVHGTIRYEQWVDRDGVTKQGTKIIVDRCYLVGGRGAERPAPRVEAPQSQSGAEDDFDDDSIPF